MESNGFSSLEKVFSTRDTEASVVARSGFPELFICIRRNVHKSITFTTIVAVRFLLWLAVCASHRIRSGLFLSIACHCSHSPHGWVLDGPGVQINPWQLSRHRALVVDTRECLLCGGSSSSRPTTVFPFALPRRFTLPLSARRVGHRERGRGGEEREEHLN